MSILFTFLLILFLVVAALLIAALFTRKAYSADSEILINRSLTDVFAYIRLLRNQDNFSKWATMDPGMKKSYRGNDGTPGFVSAWESKNKNVGAGEQEILSIRENDRIEYELRFLKPFPGKAKAYMTTRAEGSGSTRVVWGFESSMAYPMKLMLLFMNMEKVIGNDFQTGLERLKGILEK
jgi:uncharacterized protein YndB with AHSA1/START domain